MARELGMTVRELLARTDSRELTEWQAYFKIEAQENQRRDLDRKAMAAASRQSRRR